MTRTDEQFELCRRLIAIAADLSATRTTVLSDETIGVLRDQVIAARGRLLDDGVPRLIDYEATCLVEIMAELAFARSDRSVAREDRARMYLNHFRIMMQGNLDIATRCVSQVMQ